MEDISDSELWSRAVAFGEAARKWRQKFLGLLPEVARRELWRVHGFESVFVFAFKVGGVSKEQVKRVLGVEERLRDKPVLHQLLVSGEVSMNKLVRVVSVATKANEEELSEQVQLLPRQALETLVRDMKSYQNINKLEGESANMSNRFSFVHVHNLARLSSGEQSTFALSQAATQKLQELHNKGIDISEFILTAVEKREQEIQQAKENIAVEMETQAQERQAKLPSRHIPQKIKSIIKKEYGTKCAISNCQKPSRDIHHTARYRLLRQTSPYEAHNPLLLVPLCKQHHQIAHSIDVKVQEMKTRYIGNS